MAAREVLMTAGWFYPESTGGTEVYVASLARELRACGWNASVAAPHAGRGERRYDVGGVPVYRYAAPTDGSSAAQRGWTVHEGFDQFSDWLARHPAGIYHQHSFTLGCGAEHLVEAKRLGKKTVLTIHVGGNVCLKASLIDAEGRVCDGRIDRRRCSACWGRYRGMPALMAAAVAQIPAALSRWTEPLPWGRAGTALATPALVEQHRNRFAAMTGAADRIVVPCGWLRDALVRNGVPSHKITLCRQGVASIPARRPDAATRDRLRIGFFGRCTPEKGMRLLLDAVQALPGSAAVSVHLHAVAQDDAARAHREALQKDFGRDPRVHWEEAIPADQVAARMQDYDLIAVPSQVLETGPLVVLEAFAAGVPVAGTDLGGIRELVAHDLNGALLPAGAAGPWTDLFSSLAAERAPLERWRRGIGPVRTMADVAKDMMRLYEEVAA